MKMHYYLSLDITIYLFLITVISDETQKIDPRYKTWL